MVPTEWSKVNASGWPKVGISSYVSTSRYEERRPTEVKLQSEDGKTWYSPVETFRQADGSRMYITEDKQYVLSVHVLVADGSQSQHELQMGNSDLRKVMPRILSFSTDTSGDVHWSILCYETVRHDLQTWVDSIMELEISEANVQLVTRVFQESWKLANQIFKVCKHELPQFYWKDIGFQSPGDPCLFIGEKLLNQRTESSTELCAGMHKWIVSLEKLRCNKAWSCFRNIVCNAFLPFVREGLFPTELQQERIFTQISVVALHDFLWEDCRCLGMSLRPGRLATDKESLISRRGHSPEPASHIHWSSPDFQHPPELTHETPALDELFGPEDNAAPNELPFTAMSQVGPTMYNDFLQPDQPPPGLVAFAFQEARADKEMSHLPLPSVEARARVQQRQRLVPPPMESTLPWRVRGPPTIQGRKLQWVKKGETEKPERVSMENGFSEERIAILYSLWSQLKTRRRTSEDSGVKFAEKYSEMFSDICTEMGAFGEGSHSEKEACTALNMFLHKMMKLSNQTHARRGAKGRPGEWQGAILNHQQIVNTCKAASKCWASKKLRIEKI